MKINVVQKFSFALWLSLWLSLSIVFSLFLLLPAMLWILALFMFGPTFWLAEVKALQKQILFLKRQCFCCNLSIFFVFFFYIKTFISYFPNITIFFSLQLFSTLYLILFGTSLHSVALPLCLSLSLSFPFLSSTALSFLSRIVHTCLPIAFISPLQCIRSFSSHSCRLLNNFPDFTIRDRNLYEYEIGAASGHDFLHVFCTNSSYYRTVKPVFQSVAITQNCVLCS